MLHLSSYKSSMPLCLKIRTLVNPAGVEKCNLSFYIEKGVSVVFHCLVHSCKGLYKLRFRAMALQEPACTLPLFPLISAVQVIQTRCTLLVTSVTACQGVHHRLC